MPALNQEPRRGRGRDSIATRIAEFVGEVAPIANHDRMTLRIFCQDGTPVSARFEIQLALSPRRNSAITGRSVRRANAIVSRAAGHGGRSPVDHGNVAFHFRKGRLDSFEVTIRKRCVDGPERARIHPGAARAGIVHD